ncbi:trichothecene C-15 hydroxylase [Pyricularia oryzae Y34]|uniref:Trichothecene C-15 hydroxylase n=1 Tax=Pyricularia oryzae (strain Y34) TaxID=1143189 RepID=A0AA97NX64_PYRO3|nr:trichothecene C-15 hydroxylase [Pyricularia oryzae Y34]
MFSLFETLRPVNVFNRIGIYSRCTMFFFTFYEGYRVQNRGRIPRRTFGTTPNTISCVFGPGHGGTRAYPPWIQKFGPLAIRMQRFLIGSLPNNSPEIPNP